MKAIKFEGRRVEEIEIDNTLEALQAAVDGAISKEQALKLRQCLAHIDELDAHKSKIEQEIFLLVEPYTAALDLLRTVPGLNTNPMTAIAILSEIGADMSVFPTSKHLTSWAGCCPRNDKSDRKIKSTRISRAGSYLKPVLVQIANALIKSKKNPEFKERYRRIKARRGHKKAIIAICRYRPTSNSNGVRIRFYGINHFCHTNTSNIGSRNNSHNEHHDFQKMKPFAVHHSMIPQSLS